MGLSWRALLTIVGAAGVGVASALPDSYGKINAAEYAAADIITRDVCVIGGGSSGTYAAIRLGEMGKSIVVVEQEDRLGGHTQTYTDPATQVKVDYGVVVWHDLDIVKNYFASFDIPLTKTNFDSQGVEPRYVDFRTGKLVTGYSPANATDALTAYGAQIAQYPYLEEGYYLPDPVPADLLLPFGDFVKKYALDAAVEVIFSYNQGIGDMLRQPTIYVVKLFGLDLLRQLQVGFLTTARHDNSELYEKARTKLGADALLSSRILAVDRDDAKYAKILVQTPSGCKLIQAKKIVLAIPPKLENLVHFDLDQTERSLFGQFHNAGYYTGLLRNSGIPDNISVSNIDPNTPYNLPPLPGVYSFYPTGIPGLQNVKYGSSAPLPDQQVKADIIATVERLRTAGIPTTIPDFAVFSAHVPFELTVSADAIKDGFYKHLYALQGHHRTYYTGAAFHVHDSSLLWRFTEALLPQITA